jgi:purine-binding chemotaxis protein CheW
VAENMSEKSGTELQFVVFELGQERYGAPIERVREIIRPPEITRVPRAPEFVEGVINLRGRIVPVVNLRRRFGFPECAATHATRIVVVVDEAGATVGLVVDAVAEVARIHPDAVEPAGAIVASLDNDFLRGIVKRPDDLIVLLDVDRVLDERSRVDAAELAPVA